MTAATCKTRETACARFAKSKGNLRFLCCERQNYRGQPFSREYRCCSAERTDVAAVTCAPTERHMICSSLVQPQHGDWKENKWISQFAACENFSHPMIGHWSREITVAVCELQLDLPLFALPNCVENGNRTQCQRRSHPIGVSGEHYSYDSQAQCCDAGQPCECLVIDIKV